MSYAVLCFLLLPVEFFPATLDIRIAIVVFVSLSSACLKKLNPNEAALDIKMDELVVVIFFTKVFGDVVVWLQMKYG